MSAPERRRTAPAGRPSLQAVPNNPNAAKRTGTRNHAMDLVAKHGANYVRLLALDALDVVTEAAAQRVDPWPTPEERDVALAWLPEARKFLAAGVDRYERRYILPPFPPAAPAPPMPRRTTARDAS